MAAKKPTRKGSSARSRKPGKVAAKRPASRKPARVARSRVATVGQAFGAPVRSISPFLWFDDDFHEAAQFYVKLFPGSRILGLHSMGGSIELAGQKILGLNGGPTYKLSPAFSLFVVCKDQKEVDRLWAAFSDGGRPSQCGWIDDKFGVTWQVIPETFLRLTSDPDPKKVQAVFAAMMGMVKMDVKGLQAAYDAA